MESFVLSDPNYDTIAGYILGHLGRMAQIGDAITIDGATLRVTAMDGLRIARISILPTELETVPLADEIADE